MIMRMLSIVAAAVLFCSGPVLAQSIGEKTGVSAALGMTPSTADFVTQAAISDMFEIQSSELALQRGDAATKKFAEQMITAHKKTSEELKSLVASGKVKEAPPTKLDSAHQEKLDKLKGLQGADFDKQYRSDQEDAHEDAVSLFERYAEGGDNPALKEWAGKTLPSLRQHLETAEKLDD
jgi:putative membrane protein